MSASFMPSLYRGTSSVATPNVPIVSYVTLTGKGIDTSAPLLYPHCMSYFPPATPPLPANYVTFLAERSERRHAPLDGLRGAIYSLTGQHVHPSLTDEEVYDYYLHLV